VSKWKDGFKRIRQGVTDVAQGAAGLGKSAVDAVRKADVKSTAEALAKAMDSAAESAKTLGDATVKGANKAVDVAKDTSATVASAASATYNSATELLAHAVELREYLKVSPETVVKLEAVRALINRVKDVSWSPSKTKIALAELKSALEAAKTPDPQTVSIKALNVLLDATIAVVNRALGFGGPTLIAFALIAVNRQLDVLDIVLAIALGAIEVTGSVKKTEDAPKQLPKPEDKDADGKK
jgi:hypothetical protein